MGRDKERKNEKIKEKARKNRNGKEEKSGKIGKK